MIRRPPRVRSDPDPSCSRRGSCFGRGIGMSQWRPDDSLLDRNAKGELKGARKVNEVLRKGGIRRANRVTTSRDPGMTAAKNALKRTGMPAGVEQWQLPVALP